jgi:hypothetical protein
MSSSVEGFTATGWSQLAAQATKTMRADAGKTDLPAIAPGSAAWAAFKQSSESRAAYTAQLNTTIKHIQQFLGQHANTGAQRQQAISNLNHFLQTRVNCNVDKLSPLVINESRRNLNLFAQQLNNPNIPADKKLSCALALAQGLGVCNEGETLNILENTKNLCSQQTGLSGVLTRAKNNLVEQHLQQLVRHEDQPRLSDKLAQELEIHHVQALKNHVAGQWGLEVVEDRYATQAYQNQAGPMAEELLRQTITPAVLANTVAEQIAQTFCNHTHSELSTGIPTEHLKTEPLRLAIQAEFGPEIELENCLEFNADYTQVKLKPLAEISLHVMEKCQDLGLIHPHANAAGVLKQPTPNIQACIKQVGLLRGAPADNSAHSPMLSHFWAGYTKIVVPDSEKKRHQKENPPAVTWSAH